MEWGSEVEVKATCVLDSCTAMDTIQLNDTAFAISQCQMCRLHRFLQ